MSSLLVSDFDFPLPAELIAQQPPAERGKSRMLLVDRTTDDVRDALFSDFPAQLRAGDLLVLNDTRVLPARLYARRTTVRDKLQPTALVEVFLTEEVPSQSGELLWKALVKPGKKVAMGERLAFPNAAGEVPLEAEVLDRGEFGERLLRFDTTADFHATLDAIGHMPLPPYIHRDDALADRERYQTVFSQQRGSVAAPTAGLHFTPAILEEIAAQGVQIARLTLHVGLGTFAPLRVDRLDEVRLHRERYTLSAETAQALNSAKDAGRRIVAVGTTVVRTLEHCAREANGEPLQAHSGSTEIFISPGFEFRMVNALLTNFHLPKSSLLMLVSAFAGRERVLSAYHHAVENQYRFFSYGDCMFLS